MAHYFLSTICLRVRICIHIEYGALTYYTLLGFVMNVMFYLYNSVLLFLLVEEENYAKLKAKSEIWVENWVILVSMSS